MTTMKLSEITRDPDMQSRAGINDETVSEYAAAMSEGAEFPPLRVIQVEGVNYLVDGWHRFEAARRCGLDEFAVETEQGTRRDALLFSIGANLKHGLRPSSDDKRRAIRMLLLDPEWRSWSNTEVGRRAGADKKTVGKYRQQMIDAGEIPAVTERKTADGRVMNVSGIEDANQDRNTRIANGAEIIGDDETAYAFDMPLSFTYREIKLNHGLGGLLFMAVGWHIEAQWVAIGSDANIARNYLKPADYTFFNVHPEIGKPVIIVHRQSRIGRITAKGEKVRVYLDERLKEVTLTHDKDMQAGDVQSGGDLPDGVSIEHVGTFNNLDDMAAALANDTDLIERPEFLHIGQQLELTDGRLVVVKDVDLDQHTVTITRDGGRGKNQTNVMNEKKLWSLIKREAGLVPTTVHHLDLVRTRAGRFGIALVVKNETGRYVEIWDGERAQSHKPHTIAVISRYSYPKQIDLFLDAMSVAPFHRKPTYDKTGIKPLVEQPAPAKDEKEAVQGDLDEALIDAMAMVIDYLNGYGKDDEFNMHIDFLVENLPLLREQVEASA